MSFTKCVFAIPLLGMVILSLCSASTAVADGPLVVLTMDDLPTQTVDGLVHPSGVTFGFTEGGLPGLDAFYNSGGPGTTAFVEDPSIEGTTDGALSFMFETPTDFVQFGLAVSLLDPADDAFVVDLFSDDGALISSTSLDVTPLPGNFADAQFEHQGTAVGSVAITFGDLGPFPQRFAFDNLTFRVPESSTWSLLLAPTLGLLAAARRS